MHPKIRMKFIERLLQSKIPIVFWIFFIFIVSLFPGKRFPGNVFFLFDGSDKIIHTWLYAVLAFLVSLNFYNRKGDNCKFAFTVISFVTLFGILIEMLQLYLPFLGRSFEMYDILFNFLGAIVGYGLFKSVKQKF